MSRKEDKNLKKDRILQTALKLFSRQGFGSTTTKEIAAECGVAEGLIFYYFGDKRKLLLEIVRKFTFLLHVEDSQAQLSHLSLEDALVQYGLKYLTFLKENSDYILLIWSPEMFQDEMVSQEVLQLLQKMGAAGEALLNRGSSEEQAKDTDTYVIALTTFTSSLLVHYMVTSRFGAQLQTIDDETYVRKLVDLLVNGLTHSQERRLS
ncbi:TetR/AcrR family transcriptional regulator [Paenibacillus turpanensis]|uniref:TetR/AcrR family transcriptional regulator n=1 Tax=Paenibacillus turpanensis TaxID=2689078 RepID=UPI0014080A03|nr:TetR/AcrR family transcriptional regulator [Paenibacillus turpanensis]